MVISSVHLVVECFAVEMDEGGIELDIVAAPGREGRHFPEGGDVVAGACGRNVGLFHHVI